MLDEPQDPIADTALANTWITGTGQVITNLHRSSQCHGRGCVIHGPSDHHMVEWPTHFRGPVFVPGDPMATLALTWIELGDKPPHTERICEHGVGHPDPDDVAYFASRDIEIGTHGCDGCCTPPF